MQDLRSIEELVEMAREAVAAGNVNVFAQGERGRPRKEGVERDAKGKIKRRQAAGPDKAARALKRVETAAERAKIEDDARSVARWQVARQVIEGLGFNPMLASPLGRMFVLGKPFAISAAQFEAATRYGKVLSDYRAMFLSARSTVAAQDPNRESGAALRAAPEDDHVMRLRTIVEHCRVSMDAHAVLSDSFVPYDADRSPLVSAVEKAIDGESVETIGLQVHQGLEALVQYFGLDKTPKQVIRRAGEKMQFAAVDRVRAFKIERGA